MLRLLHFIHSVDPAGGGPANFIRQMIEAQIKLALPVSTEILSLDCPGRDFVESFPAPVHALGPGWGNYGYTGRLQPWLRERSANYHLVVVHGLWQYTSFGTYLSLRGTGTPYVVFPHGMLDPWFNKAYPLKHLKKALYWPWAEYKVLKNARLVIFTADDEKEQAHLSFSPYQCNDTVASLGTEGPPGDRQAQLSEFYTRFPELRDKRILLFLGRIHEKKGVDLLLSAFAGAQLDPSWRLVLAGPPSGSQSASIKGLCKQLNGRVTMTGMLTGNIKWGALQAAEVLALPSHQENFALSVSESLSCGTPVLISKQVNTWRYICDAEAGLAESDDLPGMRKLLEHWLAMSSEERSTMSRNAERCYRQRFDINVIAARMTELFDSCARRSDAIYDV